MSRADLTFLSSMTRPTDSSVEIPGEEWARNGGVTQGEAVVDS